MGLAGMRERIGALGGSVAIADANGGAAHGAELRVVVPVGRGGGVGV
jgi:signal transduction histidine kinase